MDSALIDTDILSEVLRGRDAQVLSRARAYLQFHGRLAFSAITFYEILRGLRRRQAMRQLASFRSLAATSEMLPVTIDVLDLAASLWAEAHAGGHARNDADLIIAATALDSGLTLISGNLAHFNWIQGLKLDDWRQP